MMLLGPGVIDDANEKAISEANVAVDIQVTRIRSELLTFITANSTCMIRSFDTDFLPIDHTGSVWACGLRALRVVVYNA